MKRFAAIAAAVFVTIGIASAASAQTEITLLSPNPSKETVDKLVKDLEAKTGNHVKITYGSGLSTRASDAKGEIEIAFGPYLSDMRNTGIDVVGALPPDAATPVDITGFLSTTEKNPAAARALIAYLRSPEAAAEWRAAKAFPVQ